MSSILPRKMLVILTVLSFMLALPWSGTAVTDQTGGLVIDTVDAPRTIPGFTNVSDTSGLVGKGGSFFSWGDFNDDGFMDFLVNGKFLYENSGPPGFSFTDVTALKGLSSAGGKGVWGDYDNDGDLDLFVANWNDKLFQNQGPPNFDFIDVTAAAGNVGDTHPGTAASWGDFDNDGDLDLYIVNGEVWASYTHYPDTFWMNNGDGTFTNITDLAEVNTSARPHYGRGAIWGDYDNDGWQDLYISNYRLQYNYLYYNNRNGTFVQRSKELNAAGFGRTGTGAPGDRYFGHTIGSSFADLNNDGWLDIFVSNLVHKDPDRGRYCDDSNIYINNGFPYWNFTDIRQSSGVQTKKVGGVTHGYYDDENYANAAIADFDNDGYLDVYIPQVYAHSWMYSYLYRNNGNSTWTNVSDVTGLHNVTDTYAGAWADYDNDGDMDLITAGRQNEWNKTDITTPVRIRLFRNDGNSNNHLKVNLTGVLSNMDAIGAKVYLRVGDRLLMQQVETGMGSHGQQNDMRLHFGLGTDTMVDKLEVYWPSGIVQVLNNVAANQQVDIIEDTSGPRITSISAAQTTTPDNDVTVQGQVTGTIATYSWDHEGDMEFDWSGGSNSAQTFTVSGTWEYHPTFKVMDAAGTLGHIMTTKVLVENVPPVADVGDDITADEDEVVTFDGSASTDTLWDRANLTFQFFFGDGTNTSPMSNETAGHAYTEIGTYNVTLTVTDPFGVESSDNLLVDVGNVMPSVELASNDSVEEDVEMIFNATGNDTASDMSVGLEYKWDLGDGTILDWSSERNVTHTYSTSGEKNVTVFVRDDDHGEANATRTVTVFNLPPEVVLDTKTFVIDEDGLVTLSGSGSDTVSDVTAGLGYMWDFGDGNTTDWGTVTEVTHTYTYSGEFTALLLVKDIEGVEVNDTASVKVYNVPPLAQISEAPVELEEDEEGYFLGLGIDTPTDMLSLQFLWEFGDGTDSGWLYDPEVNHTYTSEGDFDVRFTVRDNDGDEQMVDTLLTVTNPPPAAEILTPERTTVDEDEAVRFSGNGTDTASDLSGLNFTWTIEGGDTSGKEADHVFTKAGSYEVSFTVMDDEGASATEKITIRVNNIAPTVRIQELAQTVKVGDSLSFSAIVNDSPSDIGSLVMTWDHGAGNEISGQGTPNVTITFERAGAHDIRITVKDDDGEEASGSVRIMVEGKKVVDGDDTGLGDAMLYGGIGAIIAVVVIVVTVLLMRSKGGPREEDREIIPDERVEEKGSEEE